MCQFKPGVKLEKQIADRDEAYKEFVRSLPCLICGKPSRAHHIEVNGIGIKGSDYSCINLCDNHHTIKDESIHKLGTVNFERYHRLNLQEHQIQLLRQYIRQKTKEANETN